MFEHQNTEVKIVVFLCTGQVNVGVLTVNETLLDELNVTEMRDCKSPERGSALVRNGINFSHELIIACFGSVVKYGLPPCHVLPVLQLA